MASVQNELSQPQDARTVLMIRPVRFQSNPQTAGSNRFQRQDGFESSAQLQDAAALEFDGLVDNLRQAGVRVVVFDDTEEPHTPDSVFPNNWVSFHNDGTVVLYPMLAENRRPERRVELLDELSRKHGFRIDQTIDLSQHENNDRFLEGTGSLVLDRINRIAYACVSARTDLDVLGEFGQRMNYDVVVFEAVGRDGAAVYHTNVLMSIGEQFAVICAEAISDDKQRTAVLARLSETGREVVEISMEQLEQFAGNMLELENDQGEKVLAMSSRAFDSLSDKQRATLEKYATIVSAPVNRIEDSAGGSVRCMIAEVHLPVKES